MAASKSNKKSGTDDQVNLADLKKDLLSLRVQDVQGELKTNHMFKDIRKQIARLLSKQHNVSKLGHSKSEKD